MRCSAALFVSLALSLFLHIIPSARATGTAPCHSNRKFQGDGVNCEIIKLPPKLCKVCKLRPTLARGMFASCSRIYDLMPLACRRLLRKYARLNPCDEKRNAQVQDFSNPENVLGLDYFVYSVCEECCDCIPRGTKSKEDYTQLKAAGTLIKVDRANCVTHANFDVCKVWPNIRFIYKGRQSVPDAEELEDKWPIICPKIRKWKDEFPGKTFNVDEVPIPADIRQFLTRYTSVAPCRDRTVWEECFDLEKSQNRL